ncbi:MAG: cytochrome c3 family protein [Candidatus Aminicenantia bacterium]
MKHTKVLAMSIFNQKETLKNISFKKLDAEQSSKICLRCHIIGKVSEWNHSAPSASEVGYPQCHSIHGGNSLLSAEPKLCLDCHKEIRAKICCPSHHPIKEGKNAVIAISIMVLLLKT